MAGIGMLLIAGFVVTGTMVIPEIIRNVSNAKRRESFSSWKSLTEAAPNIVVGEVGKIVDTVKIDGLRFVITEINATTTLKGKMSSTTFNLLHTDVKQDPLVKRGSTVLLSGVCHVRQPAARIVRRADLGGRQQYRYDPDNRSILCHGRLNGQMYYYKKGYAGYK